tara:strand:- start:72 stop:797 length:726 start_codon:yes stop_codon:yes gene_type:complete
MELNKIYNKDCLETMAKMTDDFVDYSLTSPPYNLKESSKKVSGFKYIEYKDDLTSEQYFENQKQVIEELLRVTKYHVFYNIQMLTGNKFALHRLIGYFYKYIKEVIIWDKGFGQPAISEKVFNSSFEYIIIFSSKDPNKRYFKDASFDRGTQSNIFRIKNKHSNPFSDKHKAIFPLDIPRYFMKAFGKDNDIWYDPYMGTGTTAVAATEEKKQFIGSEIFEEYCELANNRLKPYLIQTKLF